MRGGDYHELVGGRYEVLEPLHRGSDSASDHLVLGVWDRVRSVRLVLKGWFGNREPVLAEFRRLRRACHPRIPRPHDLGRTTLPDSLKPLWYFTETWIPGRPLTSKVGRMTPADLVACAQDLLELTAFLHRAGLHRLDIKPAHLLESPMGWCLIDLDQARETKVLEDLELHGTLAYAAPETLRGEAIGPRSDLYSVGALLYEAITGQPRPVEGSTVEQIARFLEASPVPDLPAPWPSTAPALCNLVRALLAPHPKDRPPDATAALEQLASPTGHGFRNRIRGTAPRPLLAGRSRLLSRVDAAISAGEPGDRNWVVLTGPPHCGLSRVLEELNDRWQSEGHLVVLVSDPTSDEAGGVLSCLIRHLQAWSGRLADGDGLPRSNPEGADAIQAFLDAVVQLNSTQDAHVRILIDDVEHMSAEDQRAIARLLAYPEAARGVSWVLGTHLPLAGGKTTTPLLRKSSGHLNPMTLESLLAAWPQIPVDPLDEEAVRVLVEDRLGPGARPGGHSAAQLARATRGSPGHLLECLSFFEEYPDQDLSVWVREGASARVAALQKALSRPAWRLVEHVACLEVPIRLGVLEDLAAQVLEESRETGDRVESLIHNLVGAGVMARMVRGREVLFQLADSWLRPAVMTALGERAAATYLTVAEAVERSVSEESTVPPAEIARLFVAAGAAPRALPYLDRAIKQATKKKDWEALVDLYGIQAQVLEGYGTRALISRWHRAEALERVHRYPEARKELDRALEAEGENLSAPILARLLLARGRILVLLGDPNGARRDLEKAVTTLEASPDPDTGLLTDCLHRLAWVYLEAGQVQDALRTLEQARPPNRESPVRILDRLHLEATVAIRKRSIPADLKERLEEGVRVAETLEQPDLALTLQNCLAQICVHGQDETTARTAYEALLTSARKHFDVIREAAASHNFSLWLRAHGHQSEAADHLERAIALYSRIGHTIRATQNRLTLVDLLLEQNRLEHAATLLNQVSEAIEDSDRQTRLGYEVLLTRWRCKQGKQEMTDSELKDLLERVREAGQDGMALEVQSDRMAVALASGRPQDVVTMYHEVAELVATTRDPVVQRIHDLVAQAHTRLSGKKHPAPPSPTDAPTSDRVRLEDPALAVPMAWLDRLERVLLAAENDTALAAELAHLAGELLGGRGLVLLYDGTRPQIVQGPKDLTDSLKHISNTILEKVRTTRKPFLSPDVLADRNLQGIRSLRASHVRSVACQPVLRDNACIGFIYVDHPSPRRLTEPGARRVLERIAVLTREILDAVLRRDNQNLEPTSPFGLLGSSAPMKELRRRLEIYAKSSSPDLTVLFLGETGTGKSLIARKLHEQGMRRRGPFVAANCAALPHSLFSSLMFGHARGAFTGAHEDTPGLFGQAETGTLFLDEIAELPPEIQAALLEPLGGSRRYCRLGDTVERKVDFHLFCATTKDLKTEAKEGRFREELLRRINVNVCRIPSLRERGPEDIDQIAGTYIAAVRKAHGLTEASWLPPHDYMTRRAIRFLHEYDWPQNVAQLENLFRNELIRHSLLDPRPASIDLDLLEDAMSGTMRPTLVPVPKRPAGESPPPGLTNSELDKWLLQVKREYFRKTVDMEGNITAAAKQLRCSRDLVYKLLKTTKTRQ